MSQYDHPSQFEPLLPDLSDRALLDKARKIALAAQRLQNSVFDGTRQAMRTVVRHMNAYYSNQIENSEAHPSDALRALRGRFSENSQIAHRQRISVGHIHAALELEHLYDTGLDEYTGIATDSLVAAHSYFYSELSPADRTTPDGRLVQPGRFRLEEVLVGNHLPPTAASIPAFLRRMDEVYAAASKNPETLLLTIAAAHHRASWVHPFSDGNGRACRLQTEAALLPISGGLWSVSRGFARKSKSYFDHLAAADSSRQGDLDGRGNLSMKGLHQWCEFFLDVIRGEVICSDALLTHHNLVKRVSSIVTSSIRRTPLHEYAAQARHSTSETLWLGPISRRRFLENLKIPPRHGELVTQWLLDEGFLELCGPFEEVCCGFALDKLDNLLPGLFPEASPTTTSRYSQQCTDGPPPSDVPHAVSRSNRAASEVACPVCNSYTLIPTKNPVRGVYYKCTQRYQLKCKGSLDYDEYQSQLRRQSNSSVFDVYQRRAKNSAQPTRVDGSSTAHTTSAMRSEAEKIIRLALKIFKDERAFDKWISSRMVSLQGKTPIEVMRKPGGFKKVRSLLRTLKS
jgi:Fic family protein